MSENREPSPLAVLLDRPNFRELLQRAEAMRRETLMRESDSDYSPPDKPLHQYTLDELDTAIARCPYCGGYGYVRVDVDDIHDPRFGRMEHCPVCTVYQREKHLRAELELMQPRIQKYTMLKDELLLKTFDNYEHGVNGAGDHDGKTRLATWTAVRQWAAGVYFQRANLTPWLYLHGPTGGGKTHLAAAAANGLQRNHMSVIFSTLPELLGMVSENGYKDREPAIRAVQEIPILFIDDIREQELQHDWVQTILFRILDNRSVQRAPTMLVSNLPLMHETGAVAIADFEPRLASRIGDTSLTQIVPHIVPDYRLMKRSA